MRYLSIYYPSNSLTLKTSHLEREVNFYLSAAFGSVYVSWTWGTCLHTFYIKEINHRFLRTGTFLHLFLKDNVHISGYDFGSWVVVIYNECSNVFKRGIQSLLWASWIVLQKRCESWTSSSIWWPPTRTIGRYKTRYRNHCLPSWCQGLFCPWVFHFFKSNHEVRRYLRKFRRNELHIACLDNLGLSENRESEYLWIPQAQL